MTCVFLLCEKHMFGIMRLEFQERNRQHMKFFHLSDLHIGLKLINRDLREDQEYIFHQIAELAIRERPDALVIAGDIYDKAVPSAEAMEVLDGFIEELTQNLPELVIMMISGNHDSAVRVNCYRSVLARQRLHMIGLPPVQPEEYIEKVVLRDAYGSVNFYLLPFVKPSMVKLITGTDEKGNNLSYDETLRRMLAREEINMAERNVLVSHQFYLPAGKEAEEVWEAIGCEECLNTGYSHRRAIYEMFELNETTKNMIRDGETAEKIRRYQRERGFLSLQEQAAQMVMNGEMDMEEAEKVIYSAD